MHNKLKLNLLRAILAVAPFIFIGCEKSTGQLGLQQVVADKAELGTKKNFPVIAYTTQLDSLISVYPAQEIVGAYIDPVFGGVKAALNTHMVLTTLNPEFPAEAVCDSVVFFMAYNGYYGDTAAPVTFVVNALDEYMGIDTMYSNSARALGAELGRTTVQPRPNTIIAYQGDTLAPALHMHLDKDFFQENLINASRLAQSYFVNNTEFIKHINGFQLRTEGYADGLLYCNINSLASFIKVYYRNFDSDTTVQEFELLFGAQTALGVYSHTFIEHDFSLANFDMNSQDTVNGEATLHIQSLAGAATRIVFPDLKVYQDSGYVINRAELVLPVREGSVGNYPLPGRLEIFEEKNGLRYVVADFVGLGIGGQLDAGFLRDREYVFNITRQIHQYMNTNDTINPLIIYPLSSMSQARRVVLNGYTDPVEPIQFNIYFTKTK